MPQEGATFVRSGRGGAGNFVKPAAPEEKSNVKDYVQRAIAATSGGLKTGSSGRGGAGNFPNPGADAAEREGDAVEHAKAVASARVTRPAKTGLSGRGGAGNWTDDTAQDELTERRRKEDLESRILQDVGAGLAMPPPAYHQPDRGGEDRSL